LEKIRLYIDEDLTDRIAVALRSRGYDVISAHEVKMRGGTDKEQLEFATKNNRIILTRNIKHFVILQREYYRHGLLHKGIIVTDYLPLKELMRRIMRFLNKKTMTEMRNCLEWLQNYK
jgi:uncharacterized protein with PIN domain